MSDPNQFLVDYESIRTRYDKVGILGNGKDSIFQQCNTLQVVMDKHLKKKRVQQIFNNINQDFFQKKLLQIHNSMATFYTPQVFPVLYIAIRNVTDKIQDLVVIYDFPDDYVSLESVIRKKRENKEKFEEDDVLNILSSVIETFYMCSRFSGEYMDIQMQNLFFNDKQKEKDRFMISNFGIQINKRFDQKIYNSNDKIYQNNFVRFNNNDAYIRSGLFQLGFICYIMLTMDNPNNYYNLDNTLKLEMLQKKIQHLKGKIKENTFELINGLVQREESRMNIEEIIKQNMLQKSYQYYQGDNEGQCRQYSGFIQDNQYVNIGDLLTNENEEYKGGFINGQYNGQGILRTKENIYLKGNFTNGNITEGTLMESDDYIYIGEISNNKANGQGVKINLLVNRQNNYFYQSGQFQDNQMQQGNTYYLDQQLLEGYDQERQVQNQINNNVFKYKQVQSYKLAKMNTVQLQQASQVIRKKHLNNKVIQNQQPLQQQMLYSINNNSSMQRLQNSKQFRGEGLLYLHVVGCRNLGAQDVKQQKINSYIKVEINENVNRQFNTKIVDNNENPLYHYRENIKIKMNRDQIDSQQLTITAMNFGYKNDDQLIGANTLDLAEIYFKGGIWINKFVDLYRSQQNERTQVGQVYIQMQWRPFDLLNIDKKEPVSLLDSQSISQKLIGKQYQTNISKVKQGEGEVIINIINSLHLRDKDYMGITDSYIDCQLIHEDQVLYNFYSNWITNNSDPKWELTKKLQLFDIQENKSQSIQKEVDVKKKQQKKGNDDGSIQVTQNQSYNDQDEYNNKNYQLKCRVYDYQVQNIEHLGECEINLDGVINRPNTWINQIYPLKDQKGNNSNANIYVQITFRTQNQNQQVEYPNKLR